jgi:hypothetical protein
MVQGRPTAAGCNVVHNDEIWYVQLFAVLLVSVRCYDGVCMCHALCRKDHVRHEYTAMKKWPETWGFLKDEYKQLNQTIDTERSRWIPSSPDHSPTASEGEEDSLHLPPLQPPKQDHSNPFPRTTSKEIGWRSSRKEHGLELYGRWGRGKGSILKHLKWPNDAVP